MLNCGTSAPLLAIYCWQQLIFRTMLKIFEIVHEDGEKEWCTGATNIEALANYVSTTGCDLHEMDGAEILELPKDKWSEYRVKEEDEENDQSFQEWMDKYGNGSPDIIAGTMYDV